ncbi:MAG: hypothetical protein R3E31_07390 [Chloroflexota bacterium]
MDNQERYREASTKTRSNLKSVAHSLQIRELSQLSLPQIDKVVNLVARVIPAGNIPAVILSGLARLPGRKLPPEHVQRDTNLLFEGLEKAFDTAVYGTFFAGPAAVLWGYQNLLRLAGKDPADAFPEGTWQFYINYALREDTARHTIETHGFDSMLQRYGIALNQADRMSAWVLTAIHMLHQYDDLLRNEWRERVYLRELREVLKDEPHAEYFSRLYRQWEQKRPYSRRQDAKPRETYPMYRQRQFDQFLEKAMRRVRNDTRRAWAQRARAARDRELPNFQRQMTILAYLEPGRYGDTRRTIPLTEAQIGVVYQGRYYLIPVCRPGSDKPTLVETVRTQIAALLAAEPTVPPAHLSALPRLRRQDWVALRAQFNESLQQDLTALRAAPIILNFDRRSSQLPLSKLRQAERAVGEHAITVFDTGDTFVCDMSHIFFDGIWSVALAEILTNQAISWATYLHLLPPLVVTEDVAVAERPLSLPCRLTPADYTLIEAKTRVVPETTAETDLINVKAIISLRTLFKQRSDLLQLTVNDILLLYRAIHAITYQPPSTLVAELEALTQDHKAQKAAEMALAAIHDNTNPAILIPVDASQRSPRDRVHPMTFTVPLKALDLPDLHEQTVQALRYKTRAPGAFSDFDTLQRRYLATLAGLGELFNRSKEIAAAGESTSVGTIRMLAHLPISLQRLLDKIPHQFDVLNDIIKGREVFSNVGAVVPDSTLTRFMTAKDDNENKTLAWAVITDANKVMRITLRDFRPHVAMLTMTGHEDLAERITDDYLHSYAVGINRFVQELLQITRASRETFIVPEGNGTLTSKRQVDDLAAGESANE